MKKDRFGKARTLYPDELDTLVASFPYSTPKILAATLRFSGGRCSEIAQSQWKHLSSNYLLLPATNTKTNRSRSIPINNKLRLELELWEQHVKPKSSEEFIFSGRFPNSYYKRQSFDKALRKYSPFEDISTHTFRRSVLTEMKRKGIPLDVICSISPSDDEDIIGLSGHRRGRTIRSCKCSIKAAILLKAANFPYIKAENSFYTKFLQNFSK